MKDSNLNNVFHLLLHEKQMTRRQIEAVTHLSWGAVSNVTSLLMRLGYIREVKAENPGNGRTPSYLEINGENYFTIGVDINTSGFKATLLNLNNETIYTASCPSVCTDQDALISRVTDLIHEVLDYADGCHILCIGVAMQGLVDAVNGISVQFAPCREWKNVPLAQILEDSLGIPVFLEHDPNCVLYAYSAPRQISEAILVRIDDGIGMAVMMDGRIFPRPGAFELGHTLVTPGTSDNLRLQAYASRIGLGTLTGMPFEKLAEAAAAKDPSAAAHFARMAEYLAFTISNAAQLLNISEIVICGDMLLHQDLFWNQMLQNAHIFQPQLHFSTTEVDMAAVGAAMIALERYTLTSE